MERTFTFGKSEPVTRTRPALPSKLHLLELCPLRYMVETELQGPYVVGPGPIALRGSASHAVIHKFSGNTAPSTRELMSAFSASVASQARNTGANQLVKLAIAAAGVKGLLTTEQILSACRFAREMLAKAPQQLSVSGALPSAASNTASGACNGVERQLTSRALDMEGRPDLIYKNGAVVNIVDYKTGNVLDENGNIKRAYAIQAAAYGVLAKDVSGAPLIRLTVAGPSSSWHQDLDDSFERLVETLLSTIRVSLPKNTPVPSGDLARAGAHCGSCASRLFCPSYVPAKEAALARWQKHDVCGTVSEIAWTGELGSLRLQRSDGTMASIAGVPFASIPKLARGDHIRAWSLGALDLPGRAAFASNFYLFRPDNPRISSFEGALYVG